MFAIDPVLMGVLTAAVEEESCAAYEAGFADGIRAAQYRLAAPADEEEHESSDWAGHPW
jgi:hypothetical protein